MKNSFFLVIPKQESKPEQLKDYEPKSLEQWLVELPTANPGLATRLIQDFITDMNALKMPLQMRLNALEQMRPKVLLIEDYLRSRLINTAFPKEPNDLKILHVLTEIEKEFTVGYWCVLKELSHRNVSWFQGKNIALTLQRCIKGLSSVVVSHVLMGLPIPDWVWIDLHSLYKLSVKLKKDTTKVADSTYPINKTSSPEECYRQIVLLSLSRPTGLMQKEILQVYGFIENLFPYFTINTAPVEAQQVQFVIISDEDKSPYAISGLHTARASKTYYLDLTRLYRALEKKEKLISTTQTRFSSIHILKNYEEKPSFELLEYLEQRWVGVELHKDPLFNDRLDRQFTIGLASAYGYVSDSGNQVKGKDIELEQIVHSESDRLLYSTFEKTGILSVGNLVSFRKVNQASGERSLAIINELIVAKQSGKISFGVTLLTNKYKAVLYSLASASENEIPNRGLFYNDEEHFDERSYIIIDSFIIKPEDIIKMMINQDIIYLSLKNKKNIGLGYWQFECQRVNFKSEKGPVKKGYDFI